MLPIRAIALSLALSLGSQTAQAASAPAAAPLHPEALWQQVEALRDDRARAVYPLEARHRYDTLVAALLATARDARPALALDPDLGQRAAALGLRLRAEGELLLLEPRPGAAQVAAGVLVLRVGPLPTELVLAAPHPYDDLHTGRIAAGIFLAAPIRALYLANQSRDATPASDPARNGASSLQVATDALARGLPGGLFVQLHGYGAQTSDAAGVVGGGLSGTPPALVERARLALAASLAEPDVRLAHAVPALAGLGNAQGRLLRDRAAFLHVELSLGVRRRLVEEPPRVAALGAALAALWLPDRGGLAAAPVPASTPRGAIAP